MNAHPHFPSDAYEAGLKRAYSRLHREIAKLERRLKRDAGGDEPDHVETEIALECAYAARATLADKLASRQTRRAAPSGGLLGAVPH